MKRFNAFTRVAVASLVVAITMMSGGVASAATLNVVGGQLMGASNVLVDGNLYDVQFLDGTCIDLYNGCDEVSDFTFQTQASATLASQALLDQVFLDGPEGNFDSAPHFTNGCSGHLICSSLTPFSIINPLLRESSQVQNSAPHGADPPVSFDSRGIHDNTAFYSNYNYAVWAPVPEPSTGLLLATGLLGLGATRRSRRPSSGGS